MTEPQASSVQVPPDRDAKALVAAILETATYSTEHWESLYRLRMSLGTIHGDAERLAVLLAERDAAAGDMLAALEIEDKLQEHIRTCHSCRQLVACDEIDGTANTADKLRPAALARVKGAS